MGPETVGGGDELVLDEDPQPIPAALVSDTPAAPTSVFSSVIGPAGTGKTFLAKAWADLDEGSQLCATTGIAAINLGGTTINALLGYFDTASLRDMYITGRLHMRLRKNREAGIWWYILDEVSMLSGEQLTYLARAINDVNKPTAMELHAGIEHKPIRLTLTGDFAQLSPVSSSESYAFTSEYWAPFAEHQTKLTVIRRQADADFIAALQAVRVGDGRKALEYFRHRFHPAPYMAFDGVTIKAKNDDVDRFNFARLEDLNTPKMVFVKQQEGQPRGEWKQIPEHLHLKEGALVMILANKREPPLTDFLYVNGDLGHLRSMEGPNAVVELQRGGVVRVQPVTRTHLKPLTTERRQELRQIHGARYLEFVSADGKQEIVGRVEYMPLRAAYASTCHKCQGLSLDSVQVDIRNHFFTTPGMVYVGLSRARTPQGLRLVGSPELFLKRCQVDEKVRPYL